MAKKLCTTTNTYINVSNRHTCTLSPPFGVILPDAGLAPTERPQHVGMRSHIQVYPGMHPHILGYPNVWECIPVHLGTQLYGDAFPHTGGTLVYGNTFITSALGCTPIFGNTQTSRCTMISWNCENFQSPTSGCTPISSCALISGYFLPGLAPTGGP